MHVLNIAGFDLTFNINGNYYKIPNDNLVHEIPNSFDSNVDFSGLLKIVKVVETNKNIVTKPMVVNNIQLQTVVIDEKTYDTIKEIDISTIESDDEEEESKPTKKSTTKRKRGRPKKRGRKPKKRPYKFKIKDEYVLTNDIGTTDGENNDTD